MDTNFKPGDVVELKSSGPKMTISSINTLDSGGTIWANCVWFSSEIKYHDSFILETLKKCQ